MNEPIAAGRDADVFALDNHRVLRRYRREADVSGEAAIMRYVAGHGYPVPEVFQAYGRDMVMTRVDGPTMAQAMLGGEMGVDEGAAMLADLLGRLHAIPAESDSILHLDLHPENVLITSAGPVVIDWCNAGTGPPDLDTALSALIMAQLAIGSIPHELVVTAGEFLDRFLESAPGDPLRGLDAALEMRLHNRTMTPDELAALPAAAARVRNGTGR